MSVTGTPSTTARNRPACATSRIATFTVRLTMRFAESRFTPSVTLVMRGTAGPAGMTRIHPEAAARRDLDRDQAGADALGQHDVDLRDPVGCRVPDVHEPARPAVGRYLILFRSADHGRFSIQSDSAAMRPRGRRHRLAGHALLMLRITGRAGAASTLSAGFRQVIHMYCVQISSSASSWKPCSRANARISSGADADAAPGVVLLGVRRQPVQLASQNPARLENPPRLPQVIEDHFPARDVLEDGVRVDEIELPVGEQREVRPGAVMRVRVRRAAQPLARQADHFVRNIDPVNLAEVAAQRPHASVPGRSRSRARRRAPAAA